MAGGRGNFAGSGVKMLAQELDGLLAAVVDGLEGDAEAVGDFGGLVALEVEADDGGEVGGQEREGVVELADLFGVAGFGGEVGLGLLVHLVLLVVGEVLEVVFVVVFEGDEAEGLEGVEGGEAEGVALPDVEEYVLDGVLGWEVEGFEETGGVEVEGTVEQAVYLAEGE